VLHRRARRRSSPQRTLRTDAQDAAISGGAQREATSTARYGVHPRRWQLRADRVRSAAHARAPPTRPSRRRSVKASATRPTGPVALSARWTKDRALTRNCRADTPARRVRAAPAVRQCHPVRARRGHRGECSPCDAEQPAGSGTWLRPHDASDPYSRESSSEPEHQTRDRHRARQCGDGSRVDQAGETRGSRSARHRRPPPTGATAPTTPALRPMRRAGVGATARARRSRLPRVRRSYWRAARAGRSAHADGIVLSRPPDEASLRPSPSRVRTWTRRRSSATGPRSASRPTAPATVPPPQLGRDLLHRARQRGGRSTLTPGAPSARGRTCDEGRRPAGIAIPGTTTARWPRSRALPRAQHDAVLRHVGANVGVVQRASKGTAYAFGEAPPRACSKPPCVGPRLGASRCPHEQHAKKGAGDRQRDRKHWNQRGWADGASGLRIGRRGD
jgi:hypothetical protein